MTNKIYQRASELTRAILMENNIAVEDMLNIALTQTRQEALQEALELVGEDEDYKIQDDGEYHFGANQKTTGRNRLKAELTEALQAKIERV